MVATTPTTASEHVLLGSRFDWCVDVEEMWDELDDATVALAAAQAELDAAGRALDAATTDLDYAEANEAVITAEARLTDIERLYEDASEDAIRQIEDTIGRTETSALAVAYRLAWDALVAIEPAALEAATASNYYPIPLDGPWIGAPDKDEERLAKDRLDAQLAEMVSGSAAYTAFRESFVESCA